MAPIRIIGSKGSVIARDCLMLAFFCKRPAAELLGPAAQAFDLWLARTPPEGKTWAMIGENATAYKAVSSTSMGRARAQLDASKASARGISFMALGGPQEINPDHQFSVVASRDLPNAGPKTNYVAVRFPTEVLSTRGIDDFVAFARQLAEVLPYDSGYASVAIAWGVSSQLSEFAKAVRGLAFRHPGFDLSANNMVRYYVGKDLRGASWLTFVGPEALERLGGAEALRSKLDAKVSLERVGGGVLLRASEYPEIGDVNRGDDLPLVRDIARALEPVTKLGDRMLNNLFLEEADRERWERRHLASSP